MKDIILSAIDGAELKVKRAYRHIDELKGVINSLREQGGKGFTVTNQLDGRTIVSFSDLGELGRQIPLIIGDAIHNLRAPLDHIWMGLWRASQREGYGTFPFHEERGNLEDMVKKSAVVLAFPNVGDIILNKIKPYKDGNELFWTITKLDKLDKHNLIIPTFTIRKIESATFTTNRGGKTTIIDSHFGGDMPLARFRTADGMKIEQNGEIALEVTFPKGDFLARKPVVETLINMAQATDEVVNLFRKTFS